jgi:chloramphenicol O-acetyltransferase type A
MTQSLDIEHWHRREVFNLFKEYDHPFFNVCINVDVTALRNLSRASEKVPFSIAYHFLSLKAANDIEPFRYRLRGDQVVIHDRIHGASTLLLESQTFKFYHFEFDDNFERFQLGAQAALARARASADSLDNQPDRDDLIYYSVLPWISFTSFAHARDTRRHDSIPKIVFGKYFSEADKIKMPLSVEVHHALVDGVHVGQYFHKLQDYFFEPQLALGITL